MRRRWLIERYVAAAILPYFALALLLLTAILFAQQAGRFAEILGATRAPLDIVAQIAAGLAPNILLFTVPMATLAGAVIGFSRMNSDSEVAAMRAAGVGTWRMLAPALLIGGAQTACCLYIGTEVVPRAAQSLRQMGVRAALIKLESPVDPRVFNTEIPGKIIYVREGDEAHNLWRGVFIYSQEGDKQIIVTARGGRIDSSREQSELVLSDAQAISLSTKEVGGGKKSGSITVDRFAQSRIKLDTGAERVLEQWRKREPTPDELEWEALVARAYGGSADEKSRAAAMALHKKLALCFAPLGFAFLGAILGARVRRGGRGAGTLWSVLVMLLYYLTLLAGEQMARGGGAPVWVGEWLATGLVFAFGGLLMLIEGSGGGKLRFFGAARERAAVPRENRGGRGRHPPSLTSLLDRSVTRSLLLNFAAIYVALTGIFLVFTLFELWRSVAANNVSADVVAKYLFFLLPFVSTSLAPLCLLVAVLATYAVMSRRGEAMAWWASGQSLYRLAVPGILFALCLGVGIWLVQENLLATFNRRQDSLRQRIKGESAKAETQSGRQWLASPDGARIYAYEFNDGDGVLANPVIYVLDASKTHVEQLITGERAEWGEDGRLELRGARTLSLSRTDDSPIAFVERERIALAGVESRDAFKPLLNKPSHLSTRSLSNYLSLLQRRHQVDAAPLYAVALQRRRSDPLMPLVMCLIGVPLALAFGRRSAMSALGGAVAVGLGFWGVIGGFQQLGVYGLLPAPIAAWSPPIIFFALGAYFMSRART